MGIFRKPSAVTLITSIIAGDDILRDKAIAILERKLHNRVSYRSARLDFSHTTYYNEEMGTPLTRIVLAFAKPISPGTAYRTKIATNAIEARLAQGSRRRVNIDPGYLDLGKLVLFSTKDHAHRIYLNDGVYAEVTLYFKNGSYVPWPWTYPDYASGEYLAIFNSLREAHKKAVSGYVNR